MGNPWKIEWKNHGKNHGNIHGKSMGNPWIIKTEKSKCFCGTPWVPMGAHGDPWAPMWNHGFPWVPMGSHGFPWVPMGSPWVPMGSHGSHGTPWGPHGSSSLDVHHPTNMIFMILSCLEHSHKHRMPPLGGPTCPPNDPSWSPDAHKIRVNIGVL